MRITFSKSGLNKLLVILIAVVIALGSIGVGYFVMTQLAAPTASPTPTPSPSPSPTPSPTAIPTPTPTPTSTPTPTPSPTATPTPTPSPTPTPTLVWNKTYGGTNTDVGRSVVQTIDGGYAIAGRTDSFGAGSFDVYLVRTDASGSMLWNQTYGGTGNDYGESIVQTVDGGYAIAGYTVSFGNAQMYLVKTDAAGTMLWNQTYGGTDYDYGWSVVQTIDGGYAIAGRTDSFGAGTQVYLVKTDSAGDMLWNKTYGGTGYDEGRSVVQTIDGGYAIAGRTDSFGAGSGDVYLVKTDAAGTMLWNKTYGGTGYDIGHSVVQTADGGYAIAGDTGSFGAGNSDVYLVRTDAAGNMVWNQTYGGTDSERGFSVVETGDGGFAIAGSTRSFGAGGDDVYLVRTNASGSMLWNKTYGGTGYDEGRSVVQTIDGGYAIAGITESFGTGYQMYLVKTDSAGNV